MNVLLFELVNVIFWHVVKYLKKFVPDTQIQNILSHFKREEEGNLKICPRWFQEYVVDPEDRETLSEEALFYHVYYGACDVLLFKVSDLVVYMHF